MPSTPSKEPRNIRAFSWPSVSRTAENLGMNAEESAPSPSSLRKRLGTTQARLKAPTTQELPNAPACRTSRTSPRQRETRVSPKRVPPARSSSLPPCSAAWVTTPPSPVLTAPPPAHLRKRDTKGHTLSASSVSGTVLCGPSQESEPCPPRTLILALCLSASAGFTQVETSLLVRLTAPTAQLLTGLALAGLETLPPDQAHPGETRLILAPGEESILAALTPAYEILGRGRPLREILGRPEAPPDSRYYTHQEVIDTLRKFETSYPSLARVYDLTAFTGMPLTHEQRRIYALKISRNVGVDENEPNIAVLAGHHAREVNTQVMAIETARRLLEGYAANATLKTLVDSNEIWIVPVVNPDGLEYVWNVDNYWRKNRRPNTGGSFGVDPNRNYPFRWKQCGYSTNPTSSTYCGPSAASEPCVRTVIELGEMRHFERVLDFHSYGQEVLFTYSPCTTSIPPAVKSAMDAAIATLAKAGGYQTRLPSASGQQPEHQWARRGTFAFLVEVMRSFQPPLSRRLARGANPGLAPGPDLDGTARCPAPDRSRDLAGRPLSAQISVTGVDFSYGEQFSSGGPHGRWFLWLTPGLYDVTFSSPGYKSARVPLTLSPSTTRVQDVILEPLPALLSRQGSDKIGTLASFPPERPPRSGPALLHRNGPRQHTRAGHRNPDLPPQRRRPLPGLPPAAPALFREPRLARRAGPRPPRFSDPPLARPDRPQILVRRIHGGLRLPARGEKHQQRGRSGAGALRAGTP